jgi:hypothetical protein
MDWWSGAEGLMKTARLSGPASVVAMSIATANAQQNMDRAVGFTVIIRAGYSLRALLPTVTSHISKLDVSSLDPGPILEVASLPVDPETGMLSSEDSITAAKVLGPSTRLVWDYTGDKFREVASVDLAFWLGTVTLATHQFHNNLGRLHQETIEEFLRYGFVLRAWEESLGIGPVDGEGNADEALVERIIERAHELNRSVLPEQADVLIATGPPAVLGQDVWEGWSDGDRFAGVTLSRAGFFIRVAELEVLPAAGDHDNFGWAGVGKVVVEMTEQHHDAQDGAIPVAAAAAFFVDSAAATDLLLRSIPGPPYDARMAVIDAELEFWRAKGVQPRGTDEAQQRSLVLYGFAASVVREFVLVAQERGDADREGRSPQV